jgi:hypothetical protein
MWTFGISEVTTWPWSYEDDLARYAGLSLRDAGYAGPLVLEIFSKNVPDSLYGGDLHGVVARSRDALTAFLGAPPR